MKYSHNQRHECLKYVNSLFDTNNGVEVKKISKNRTLSQNRYLHLLLTYFACEYGYTLEYVKQEIFKKEVNQDIFIEIRLNKKGQEFENIKSSASIDTAKMKISIDRFKNYSAANGLVLPESDDYQFLQFIENNAEKYSEWL